MTKKYTKSMVSNKGRAHVSTEKHIVAKGEVGHHPLFATMATFALLYYCNLKRCGY